jgi:histidinol-phosphate aminotransferase
MTALTEAAKAWVSRLGTYQPGKPMEEVARELGLGDPDLIIKLASNENALGPSPRALQAMRAAAGRMHIYPDGDSYYLRQALAARLKVPADHIMLGHGSNEILALLGHVYLEKGTSIVASAQAFIVYKLVAALYEATTIEVPMRDHTHDLDAMRAAIRPDTRLVFVANPNNPTGTMVDAAALDRFLESLPPHVVAVLDEAYIELLTPRRQPDTLRYVREGRGVYLLRTFSKAYGLAGLRIGYAVAPPAGIALLHRVRQPFNVNAMAQAAALAALDDEDHVVQTRAMVEEGLNQLTQAFARMGLEYVPSVANFVLVKVGKGQEVFQALQRKRVIVRPVDVYGLPEFVRVTVGTQRENQRLVDALAEVLRERKKA